MLEMKVINAEMSCHMDELVHLERQVSLTSCVRQ